MISTKEILAIHKELIDNFGGSHGVRDLTSLDTLLKKETQPKFQFLDLNLPHSQNFGLLDFEQFNERPANNRLKTGRLDLKPITCRFHTTAQQPLAAKANYFTMR